MIDRSTGSMITDTDLADFLSGHGAHDWGEWTPDPDYPHDRAWRNNRFAVLAMDAGDYVHVLIRPFAGATGEPRWRDKQRLKNELFGDNVIAIEIMPRQCDVVATSDVWHMWLVPHELLLPGLA